MIFRLLRQLFLISLFFTACVIAYSSPAIRLDEGGTNGLYIGKHIDYLNEKVIFQSLTSKWNVEPVYIEKMLSGELHSIGNMEFSFENTADGYQAHMRLINKPGSERVLKWGIYDVVKEEISMEFKPSDKSILYLNFMPHSYWLRFKIQNTRNLKADVYLELDKHISNSLDLFIPSEESWIIKRGDFIQNMNEREQRYKNIAFRFTVNPGVNTYYLRVDSPFIDNIPLRLWTQNGFTNHKVIENAFQLMVIGVFLFIFFFNVFVYLSVRDISYIYLSLMTLSGMINHLCFSGTGFQYFWPSNSRAGLQVLTLIMPMSYIFSLQFCRSFIEINRYAPRIDRIVVYLVRFLALLIVVYLVLPASYDAMVLGVFILFESLFYIPVLISAIVVVRKRNRSGIFLLIGIFLHYLSIMEWSLSSFDIIPYHLINYIHIKGTSFLIIMTLGLADKISVMKNSLIDLNLNLEKKVKERTEALAQKTAEIKEAHEKLKELDEVKSRFFANISHEIRTPLTLLISPIESILKGAHGKIPETSLQVLEIMRQNAGRLLKMVNDLLDFSKIESGKMASNPRNCDISSLLSVCVSSIESTAAANQLDVSLTDNTQGLEAVIDRDLFEKAIFNLLSNAIKFNQPGGSISVTLNRKTDHLTIAVKDSGIGIPENQLETIFERFSQVDSSSTRKHEGTGIGLSLTKEIVRLHGGEISVKSDLGKGSEFVIRIPIVLFEETVDPIPQKNETELYDSVSTDLETTADQFFKERVRPAPKVSSVILIVEDNDDMREYLNTLLQKQYTIITAKNGREALEIINQQKVDLVLADLMMPVMNGYELVQAIRAEKSLEGLPIVLLTAKSHTSNKVEGIEKGANDYITKPFSPEELTVRIQSQLRFKSLKEKILAAHRGGIKKVIIPKENEKDLKDIPVSITKQMEIVPVEHMDEVLSHALILGEGDCLFKKVDIPIEIAVEEVPQQPSIN
ncbi:response regulator [bacterium]|nr:response regulator [bacterium]